MVFSRAPVGCGQGVYVSAVAQKLAGADLDRGIAISSSRSEAHGEDVRRPARHRLYLATASEHSALGPQHRRTLVSV